MTNRTNKYKQLGLRRDRNLSDVPDKTAALNNLLNNIVNDPTGSFISEDIDAIRGLQGTNITPEKLSTLSAAAVTATTTQGFVEEVVNPPIRLIDRVRNINISTGAIPSFRGGQGLMARFIPSADFNASTASSTGDTVFTKRSTQAQEVFWDNGKFSFGNTIDPSFVDQYGGIQWTGYFVPDIRDPNITIYMSTTGLLIAETDPLDNNQWTTLLSIYADTRVIQLTGVSAGTPASSFTLAAGQYKHASIGDIVNGTEVTVTEVSETTLTLSAPISLASSSITLKKVLGETRTQSIIRFPAQQLGSAIRVRFTFWYPKLSTQSSLTEKYIEFGYISGGLPYQYLYETKPPGPGPQEIRQFLADIVSPSQNNLGELGGYKNLYTRSSLLLTAYSPLSKTKFADIKRAGPITITPSATNNVITGSLAAAEIGNILVPATLAIATVNFNKDTRIKEEISQSVKVTNVPIGVAAPVQVNVLDHRGFVGWYAATGYDKYCTIPSTGSLSVGFIVMTNTSTAIHRITSIDSGTSFTTSPSLNLNPQASVLIYVYSDRGLVDRSKEVFCNGVFGRLTLAGTNQGSTALSVATAGISPGQVVQFSPAIPSGTTVTQVVNGSLLTISKAITKTIDAGSTIVFAPATSGTVPDFEGCVLPLDNSPPFVGTAAGLSTAGKGIVSTPGAGLEVIVSSIVANSISQSNITTTTDTVANRKVALAADLNGVRRKFSILGKSS